MFKGLRSYLLLIFLGWIPFALYFYYYLSPSLISKSNFDDDDINYTINGFAVETPGCKIPDFLPYDSSVSKIVRKNWIIKCKGAPLLINIDKYMLILNRTVLKNDYKNTDYKYCQYIPIIRDGEGISDNKYKYDTNNSKTFLDNITVLDEFIKIECFNLENKTFYENFHAFILKKDQVEEKVQTQSKKYDGHFKERLSIMLLTIDSMSRLNFIRKMRKTRNFLINTLDGIDFNGFNKVGDGSFPCLIPLFTGKYIEELPWNETMLKKPFDDYNLIWKNFSDFGYRTLIAEEPGCIMFSKYIAGFFHQPSDYYMRPLGMAIYYSTWHKTFTEYCVGSKLEIQFVLDWLFDFAKKFANEPHFSYTHLSRIFHDYIEYMSNGDNPYFEFLSKLHTNNLLNNTVIIVFGDHGLRFGDIRNTFIGRLEERLPVMIMAFPKWFYKKYPQHASNLRYNADKLITPFDIYETMMHILQFDGEMKSINTSARGISLFHQIPTTRTCEDASILPHWCTCQESKKVPIDDVLVKKASLFITDEINLLTANYRNICSILVLDIILDAYVSVSNENLLRYKDSMNTNFRNDRLFTFDKAAKSVANYLITFTTLPGKAVFESTVRYSEDTQLFSLQGDISRINAFGSQSKCVNSLTISKLCYCN